MPLPPVYLASASPRRLQLLQSVGIEVRPCPVPVDETPLPGESPVDRVARLAGRTHEVWTGVHVLRPDTGGSALVRERTRVRMRAFGEDAVAWYVATGEPLDKAGAYGIQGPAVFLVEGIEGSWSNVVGLPLERLPELLRAVGIRVPF